MDIPNDHDIGDGFARVDSTEVEDLRNDVGRSVVYITINLVNPSTHDRRVLQLFSGSVLPRTLTPTADWYIRDEDPARTTHFQAFTETNRGFETEYGEMELTQISGIFNFYGVAMDVLAYVRSKLPDRADVNVINRAAAIDFYFDNIWKAGGKPVFF